MGFRNLIGITAPGGIIVLALVYGAASALIVVGKKPVAAAQIRDLQWVLVAAALLLSYLLGSVLRLNSADDVDAISSRSLELRYLKRRTFLLENLPVFRDLRQRLLRGALEDVPPGFDQWLWSTETFPYPAWELRKLHMYHPPKVVAFFEQFRDVLIRVASSDSRKEFFNYCKMVVAARTKKGDEALLHEVQDAEANVRFFAGTYFALLYSSYLIALSQVWMVANVGLSLGQINRVLILCGIVAGIAAWRPLNRLRKRGSDELSEQAKRERKQSQHLQMWFVTWLTYCGSALIALLLRFPHTTDSSLLTTILLSMGVIASMQRGCSLINHRFRLLRIKEVDIVFDAFYLAQLDEVRPQERAASAIC
jgi:hypothetical protein